MIYTLLVVLGLALFGAVTVYCTFKHEQKQWNNGVCSKCGTEWKLSSSDNIGRFYFCENDHICEMTVYDEK